jgi:hypothetical protein
VYRTIGVGAVTTTITTKGSTITTVIASLTTETATVTGNFAGADGFDFYGSAKSPCVSGPNRGCPTILNIIQCSSCTIAAATVDLFYFPTRKLPITSAIVTANGY